MEVVGHVVGGRCQAQCAWQRLPTTRPTTFYVWKTRGCQCSFRLLMMGDLSPETYWALYKYGIIKFWYIVASCWIFFMNCTMMHGSTDIKKRVLSRPCCGSQWYIHVTSSLGICMDFMVNLTLLCFCIPLLCTPWSCEEWAAAWCAFSTELHPLVDAATSETILAQSSWPGCGRFSNWEIQLNKGLCAAPWCSNDNTALQS